MITVVLSPSLRLTVLLVLEARFKGRVFRPTVRIRLSSGKTLVSGFG